VGADRTAWLARARQAGKAKLALWNFSRDRPVAYSLRIARGLWDTLRGLLFRRPLTEGEALLIPRCHAVHTYFLDDPIDLIFLDEQFCVLATIPRVPPYKVVWTRGASGVVELAASALDRAQVAKGDRLALVWDRN